MISIITNVIVFNHSITIVSKFADRLRQARLLRGYTQAALARACGLSQGAIANYETKSRKTAKDIFKLADALRVNPIWLGQGVGAMEPAPTLTLLPPPSDSMLAEAGVDRQSSRWPFNGISANQFWALSESDRRLIEDAVASLIASLRRGQ